MSAETIVLAVLWFAKQWKETLVQDESCESDTNSTGYERVTGWRFGRQEHLCPIVVLDYSVMWSKFLNYSMITPRDNYNSPVVFWGDTN